MRPVSAALIFSVLAGLLVPLKAVAGPPSFDCRKATAPDELAICATPDLAARDQETTRLFNALKAKDRVRAITIAREFLKSRKLCRRDVSCIRSSQTQAITAFVQADASPPAQPDFEPVPAGRAAIPNFTNISPSENARTSRVWFTGEVAVREPCSYCGGDNVSRYHKGRTATGLFYKYYADGSGHLSLTDNGYLDNAILYTFKTTTDKITDVTSCVFHQDTNGIYVSVNPSGDVTYISLFGHDYPGRQGAIRIDKNPPIYSNERGVLPPTQTVSELLSGRTFVTRYYKWPYDWPRDFDKSTRGFQEALEFCKYLSNDRDKVVFNL